MALPLRFARLRVKFRKFGHSIQRLKKLYFSLASLAVEACFSFADRRRRQPFRVKRRYVSCTGAFIAKIPGKLAAGGCCEIGSPRINEPSLMTKTTSKLSGATAGKDIGYTTARLMG